MRATLIILTLNEIEGSRALFERLPLSEFAEVLVVDGGSTDGTVEFFRERGINVVGQDQRGRGAAILQGARMASGEYLVFFSPDGNEDPADILKLARLLDGCDIAIASRFARGGRNEEDGHFFPARAWANRMFTFIANAAWNKDAYVSDTINGFRAVRKQVFQNLDLDAAGFVIEYQMTVRALRRGYRIREIPTKEGPRIAGKTRAGSVSTGFVFLRYLLREFMKGEAAV